MFPTTFKPETRAVVLGHDYRVVSSLLIHEYSVRVRLASPSGTDEGAFIPAADIDVYGIPAITMLRDFLSSLLERHAQLTSPPLVKDAVLIVRNE